MAKTKKSDKDEPRSAYDLVLERFGEGSIVRMDEIPDRQYDTVSTGSIGLDRALGIGGLPRGRIVEIYGPASAGKTTITLHAVADAQRQGLTCAFVDAEHALDLKYAEALGVDVSSLLISQPDYGEQALEIVDIMAKSSGVDVVVVDSVAALTPKAELDGEMGAHHVGLQARMMSQAMRKLAGVVSSSNTLVIFVNQIRMKIGVAFGSPETVTGGGALKFYSTMRLDVRYIGAVKQGEDRVASRTRVKVAKNKVSPPFRQAEFDIVYGRGISRAGEVLELGVAEGVVEKAGAWLSHDGERLGQGLQNAKAKLEENPGLMDAIVEKLKGVA